jgi:hypothetical protein
MLYTRLSVANGSLSWLLSPTLPKLNLGAGRRSRRRDAAKRICVYGRVWESEEVALLRAQRKAGVPLRDTAKQLGRSYSAVRSYASDHGILPPGKGSWKPGEDAFLLVLARDGLSTEVISEIMGRTELAIRHRLMRLNLRITNLRALGPVAPG